MSDVPTWSTTAASNNSPSPNGFPENMAPSGVNDSSREVMRAVRQAFEDLGFLASGGSSFVAVNVNVKAYGAVGDGVTDDTTAIQNAFNALTENGSLFFPAGNYLISSALTLTSIDNVTIYGLGAKIYENGAALLHHFDFTTCDYLTVEGFYFEATETHAYFTANTPSEERQFINLDNCDQSTVKNVRGKNKRRLLTALNCDGLSVTDFKHIGFMPAISGGQAASFNNAISVCLRGCDNSSATDGYMESTGIGALSQLSSDGIVFSNLRGKEIHDNLAYFSSAVNGSINGCTVFSSAAGGILARGRNISVTGNTIANTAAEYAIKLTGAGTTQDSLGATGSTLSAVGNTIADSYGGITVNVAESNYARDVNVSNNTITNTSITGDNGAIEIQTTVGGVVCNGNNIRICAGDSGIVIAGGGSTVTGVVCNGNSVVDVNGSASATRGGIRIGSTFADIVVNGNYFKDIASTVGVRLRSGSNGVVSGNIYPGGQVVTTNTDGTTSDVDIIGNTGSTILSAGEHCAIWDNNATVTGYPDPTTDTPLAVGLKTYASGNVYIADGVSATTDWNQVN